MKKLQLLTYFICAACISSFAAPTLTISESSKTFLSNRKAMNSIRTKDANKSALFKTSTKRDASKSLIATKKSSQNNIKLIETALSSRGYFTYLDEDGELSAVMEPEKGQGIIVDVSCMNFDERSCANEIAKVVLPAEIAAQYDHLSTGISEVIHADGSKELNMYVLNFMRIFNGRVVRKNNDITIFVQAYTGEISNVKAQAEDLVLTKDFIPTSENSMENTIVLGQLISEDFSEMINSENDVVKVESVNVNGVAEAYCSVNNGNKDVYYPCLSYTTTVKLDNEKEFPYIFDAPYSKSSLDKFKGKKAIVGNF